MADDELARIDVIDRLFHAATGMLAPGKDYPAAMHPPDPEERRKAWSKWNSSRAYKDAIGRIVQLESMLAFVENERDELAEERATRLASPSELTPEVSPLGAPGVPIEAIRLLEWFASRRSDYPGEIVSLGIVGDNDGTSVAVHCWLPDGADSVAANVEQPSLAEAARAALEKVSR